MASHLAVRFSPPPEVVHNGCSKAKNLLKGVGMAKMFYSIFNLVG